jgi:MEMO1 family protein
MDEVRKPAVASMFYPDDTINLKRMINNFLSNVPSETGDFFKKNSVDNYFGLIAPHAGYVYSGQVAAYAYSLFRQKAFDTVIMIGPSHFTYFEGFALSYYGAFETPFGEIEIDQDFTHKLAEKGKGDFDFLNAAHLKEHSLEVQLPFLQVVLNQGFKIVPILMGEQTYKNAQAGAEVLANLLKDSEKHYLIVISSDLSHYHSNEEALGLDKKFTAIVEQMNPKKLMEEVRARSVEACGAGPISIFLELARKLNHNHIKNLVYQNSGDVSGDYSKVVGYFSSVVW